MEAAIGDRHMGLQCQADLIDEQSIRFRWPLKRGKQGGPQIGQDRIDDRRLTCEFGDTGDGRLVGEGVQRRVRDVEAQCFQRAADLDRMSLQQMNDADRVPGIMGHPNWTPKSLPQFVMFVVGEVQHHHEPVFGGNCPRWTDLGRAAG
jgi:hypothetical protein